MMVHSWRGLANRLIDLARQVDVNAGQGCQVMMLRLVFSVLYLYAMLCLQGLQAG
jgi:hypothetical protein